MKPWRCRSLGKKPSKLKRQWKIDLIERNNPEWLDLYEGWADTSHGFQFLEYDEGTRGARGRIGCAKPFGSDIDGSSAPRWAQPTVPKRMNYPLPSGGGGV